MNLVKLNGILEACADSKGPYQTAHLRSLIRVFAVHLQNQWILNNLSITALYEPVGCIGYSDLNILQTLEDNVSFDATYALQGNLFLGANVVNPVPIQLASLQSQTQGSFMSCQNALDMCLTNNRIPDWM